MNRVRAIRSYQQAMNYMIRKEGIEEKPVEQTSDGDKDSPIVEDYEAIYPSYETYKGKKVDLKV